MTSTFFERLTAVAAQTPAAPALTAHGREPLPYAGLRDHILTVLTALNGMGIGRGDRVAIVLPNGPEMATVCLSVMAGAVAAPMNPDFKQPEYETVFERLSPKVLIILAASDHPARAAALVHNIRILDVTIPANGKAGLFSLTNVTSPAAGTGGGLDPILAQADDTALVLQTSGTTAQPKVVPLSQRNLLTSAENLAKSLQLGAADRCLHFLPLFHIGGIVDVLAAPLLQGGTVFCSPSFSAGSFYRDLTAFRPTWTQAVPVMLEDMLTNAAAYPQAVAGQQLRFVRSVSAPLPVERMQAFEKAFAVPVIEIYGMTETAGVITSNPLPPGERKPGSVGISAGPEVRVVDQAGAILPAGQEGEVLVRGDNVISGYENAPQDNLLSFSDGWFRSGDLGHLDPDGYLFLTGRVKEMINRGGEKVSPFEVDQCLLAHPAVADAAAFAVPHPQLGEDVAVLVVVQPGQKTTKEELTTYLRARLAFFKIPRVLLFVESVPRGANGKLQRKLLAEKYADALETGRVWSRPVFVAPASPVAKMLARTWADILKTDDIGMDDDFFDLGGDSLDGASLINSLQQKWGETIYVSSLFDAPTIAKYERYLLHHYPEMCARILGESFAPRQEAIARVTPAMVAELKGMIAHPLGECRPMTRKNPRAIFVLSPPRSGSTLLRAMLAGHSQLFAPPELYLLSYEDLADRKRWFSGSHRSQLEGNIRALMQIRGESAEASQQLMNELEEQACPVSEYYRMLQGWLRERILVDKTPAYAVDVETLKRAELYFEDAIYIHLLRHPYGMIRSFEEAKLDQLWFPRLVGTDAFSLETFPFARRQLAEMIWLILHQNILTFLADVPAGRQFRLRFEDVVSHPDQAMQSLCKNIGLNFEPGMLDPQGEKKQRMTDGIHDVSRMIGDPKFHQHKKIEASVAEQWKAAYEIDFLSPETCSLAAELGYHETVASAKGRMEIEL